MRVIDKENWHRKGHFDLYSGFEFPHVSICVQVDITSLWQKRKQIEVSPTSTLVYVISRAANRIPEFKQRIHGDQVVEHDVIHPLVTVMGENDLFGVVTLSYDPDFAAFAAMAEEGFARGKESASMDEFPHVQDGDFPRDDLLSITILPWLAFTGFAITRKPGTDCIPLVAIGKVHALEGTYQLPVFVNFHHALADGLHIARYIKYIQEEAQQLADHLS